MYSLAELAGRLGLAFTGDAQKIISGIATLAEAGPEDLAFLANRKYAADLAGTRAGAVILHPDRAAGCPVDCLVSEAPYCSFAQASHLFDNSPRFPAGVHPSASVSPEAEVHPDAAVGPNAVIEPGARVALSHGRHKACPLVYDPEGGLEIDGP